MPKTQIIYINMTLTNDVTSGSREQNWRRIHAQGLQTGIRCHSTDRRCSGSPECLAPSGDCTKDNRPLSLSCSVGYPSLPNMA